TVRGLPDSAAGSGDEESLGRTRNTGNIGDAALEVGRSDGAPAKAGQGEGIECLRLGGDRDARQGDAREDWNDTETMHTHSQGWDELEWKRYSYGTSAGSVEPPPTNGEILGLASEDSPRVLGQSLTAEPTCHYWRVYSDVPYCPATGDTPGPPRCHCPLVCTGQQETHPCAVFSS